MEELGALRDQAELDDPKRGFLYAYQTKVLALYFSRDQVQEISQGFLTCCGASEGERVRLLKIAY